MTDKVCSCCGQTLPPPAFEVPLTLMQRRIFELVRQAGQHGIATDRLFNSIWGRHSDGGPDSGHKLVHVHVCQINKELRPRGWLLTGEHTGSRYQYGRYTLQKLGDGTDASH